MKYKLSTEAFNAYGIQVKTNGIKIPNKNIPMLLGHNSSKVLGNWVNITKEGDVLFGEPVWDTDEDTQVIYDKVKKGFIDGISIGLSIDKVHIPDDTEDIIITESTLLEASITPLPANSEARIELSDDVSIPVTFTLDFSGEKDMNNIKDKLLASVNHNNIKKQIADKVNGDAVKIEDKKEDEVKEDEVKTEEPKNDAPKTKVKKAKKATKAKVKDEVKNGIDIDDNVDVDSIAVEDANIAKIDEGQEIDLSEDMKSLADRLIKTFSIEIKPNENKYSKVILELSERSENKDKQLLKLNKEVEELRSELKHNTITVYLDKALEDNKINKVQYEKYSIIANKGMFDEVKEIIENSKVTLSNENKLTSVIEDDNKKNTVHNFEWYQKNDPSFLIELKRNDLHAYDELIKEYLNK